MGQLLPHHSHFYTEKTVFVNCDISDNSDMRASLRSYIELSTCDLRFEESGLRQCQARTGPVSRVRLNGCQGGGGPG